VISRTEFATGVVNQHGDRVVLRYRTNSRPPEVLTYSQIEERLLSVKPLDKTFAQGVLHVIDGRYVLSEKENLLSAIDLDDVNPVPFSLPVPPTWQSRRHRTNPLLRTIEVAGRRTLLLFAIEDHSIVLRNEWQIPFSVYNRNSASFDFVSFGNYFYTLNPNETFVEKRSPTDGELVATFPIPKDYLGIGGTRPNWRMIGVVLIDYSNDLRQSYVFDFVHQRALFSLDDSPKFVTVSRPKSQHVYFRHRQFKEQNLLAVYNVETGTKEPDIKVPSLFDYGLELSDGRFALIGRGEGITVQVLNPESGAIQCFRPLRWISYAIPFLAVGFTLCFVSLIVRSGPNAKMDSISLVLFLLIGLNFWATRLSKYSDLQTMLRASEFQIYLALCTSIMAVSLLWLFFAKTKLLPCLLFFAIAACGVAASTAHVGINILLVLCLAIVFALASVAIPMIIARCFGFCFINERDVANGQCNWRFAYGVKDLLLLTFCVGILCVASELIPHWDQIKVAVQELCKNSIELSFVSMLGLILSLSLNKWGFRVCCLIALSGLMVWVFHDCFVFYQGCSPAFFLQGWLDPNDWTWNATESEWAITSLNRTLSTSLVTVFGVATVLRNHGWRIRRSVRLR